MGYRYIDYESIDWISIKPSNHFIIKCSCVHAVLLYHRFVSELVPQCAREISARQTVGVRIHESQNKDAILSQVVPDKQATQLPVFIRVDPLTSFEVLPDKVDSVFQEHESQDPSEEVNNRVNGDEYKPEPNDEIDLLVEEIDREDTLYGVALYVTDGAFLKLAHCHFRKSRGSRPIGVIQRRVYDVKPKRNVIAAKKVVQDEDLPDHIDDV